MDIDLAGRKETWRTDVPDIRIMTDVTWPAITLRYTLTQNGADVMSGTETVKDMNYLMRGGVGLPGGTLRYEKAMLNDWFKARFVNRRPRS